jgi:nicotinate-nucleotide adenylyltransferase
MPAPSEDTGSPPSQGRRVETALPADTRLPTVYPGMRIGLFGGSFDPPHEGHLEVSRVALRVLRLDQVWWLVSPHNPLKANAPSDDLHRRIAAARALANHPRIKVTGIEAALGTRYTAETLGRLLPRLRGVRCVWMMGADNLASFHRWRGWKDIARAIPIAVFNRPGSTLDALASPAALSLWPYRHAPSEAGRLAAIPPPAWVFLPSPYVAISSTELRAARRAS